MDVGKKPCLVDRYVNGVVTGFEQEIGLFRGFDPCWQENGSATGSAYTEITVPVVNIFYHFWNDGNLSQAGAVMGMGEHDADSIGSMQ